MDSALELKRLVLAGSTVSKPGTYLNHSEIIQNYTKLTNLTDLGKLFVLVGLAEIPYAAELELTQSLIIFINTNLATGQGFSYTQKLQDIVPCYNAMLLEAYCRLGLGKTSEAQAALQWIKKYQLFERGQMTDWNESGICKHGGCLKKTPCYIGIGKTMRALLAYRDHVDDQDTEVRALLSKGSHYMTQHHFFKRLSTGQPIATHITDSMFPQSYALSLTDLVYIADKLALHHSPSVRELKQLLQTKQTRTGGWKIDYIYRYNGYLSFENRRKDSNWVTDLYTRFLNTE